jgi:hypothetical protein
MASTSTNKQPLLVDRPLHEWVNLGATAALAVSSNLSTLVPGGCFALVDCADNDGAVVDSVSIINTEAGTTAASVLILLSISSTSFGITSANTAVVATAVIASAAAGNRTNISLPPLSIPVPHIGAMATPGETDKKGTGLYVPAGFTLYAGLTEPLVAPTPATTVNVFAQGGYF